MNVVNFSEEFRRLITRWTSPITHNESSEEAGIIPLTNDQVLTTVENVLCALLGVNMQASNYSSVTTPATGIEVCTPNAPIVARPGELLPSGNLSRFRSLDTLTMGTHLSSNGRKLSGEDLGSKSQEKMDIDGETTDLLPDSKKFVSKSSPAIYISTVGRQDTFIREEEEKMCKQSDNSVEEKFESADKVDLDIFSETEKGISRALLQKLEMLRDCAFDVVSRIDEVKKNTYPQNTKHIRRLSSIGSLSRSSTMLRSIPPPKLRRSSTAFPGTPTSSKLSNALTAGKTEIGARRKSISGAALHLSAAKISPASPRPSLGLSSNKKSPLSAGRPAKNPKYAHVQSTIPKSSVGKRKAP